MKISWESENGGWGFYFSLSWKAFYIAVTLAGVDIEFHFHNLREVVYGDYSYGG